MTAFTVARRVALALIVSACATSALADDVTFVMKNSHPNALEIELFSQDRPHSWPGGYEVYYFDDGETRQISLACQSGETICYGAWVAGDPEGTYWGVGPGNDADCSDCCYTCEGGETEEIELVP